MEWQPIETAPNDELILLTDGKITAPGWWSDEMGSYPWLFVEREELYKSREFFEGNPELISVNGWMNNKHGPTHWMPLPTPPEEHSK